MDLIDTHCHLNFKAFKSDFLQVAKKSCDRGVKKIIIVGSDPKTSEDAIMVASEINNACPERVCGDLWAEHKSAFNANMGQERVERVIAPAHRSLGEGGSDSPAGEERGNLTQQGHPELVEGSFAHVAVGIHAVHALTPVIPSSATPSVIPSERSESRDLRFEKIETLAEDSLVVAIGESGLDFYHDKERKTESEQIELFKKHIELALKLDKPLIIHNREADEKVCEIVDEFPKLQKAVLHCFSTDHRMAAWAIEHGFYLSFTGNITYGNKKIKKVIERTPIERIMVETDAPYNIPEPLRSQGVSRCEPYMCAEVIKKIASVKGISEQDLGEQIFKNSREFFGLS